MTSLFPLSLLGAELQRAHRYSPTRVTLHLLPALPASQTFHSYRQQYPAHHKRIKVSPAGPGLHGLLGGTHWTHTVHLEKQSSSYVDYLVPIKVILNKELINVIRKCSHHIFHHIESLYSS